VAQGRIELPTHGFSVLVSGQLIESKALGIKMWVVADFSGIKAL
jgi:hypothetical protein